MEDDIYEAEVATPNRDANLLNGLAAMTIAFSIGFLMMSVLFNDSVTTLAKGGEDDVGVRVEIWERGSLDYITDDTNGYVLEFGEYSTLETENEWNSTHVFVEYELPLEEGGAAPNGVISLAYWRPNVPDGVTVPVIAEFGPYFQEPSVQTPTIEVPGSWLGEMIIDQLLPHGYAFAQVSVTGTGRSNHCMDLMGTAEQLGNDAAVSWLGSQEWSNGNVAMIGKLSLIHI